MSDRKLDADTPASPHSSPSKVHGDALLDQSGSRHGPPPEASAVRENETRAGDDEEGGS